MLESDFALNIMGKLVFYLTVLPQEVSLIRVNDSEYPDDEATMYANRMDLCEQIIRNSSQNLVESFQIFGQYVKFVDEMCQTSVSCQVMYNSGDKKLLLIDQLCYQFSSEILVAHFQPLFLSKNHRKSINIIRTTY